MRDQVQCRRRGFSMIQLLLVLAIILFLLAMLLPAVQRVRQAAGRTQCINNFKQFGLGIHNFEGTFRRLPPLYGGSEGQVVNSLKFPRVWGSTHVFLLPYIEQDILYKSLAAEDNPRTYDPTKHGGPGNTRVVPTYVCPDDPSVKDGVQEEGTLGAASYAVNAQVFAPLTDEKITGGAMRAATEKDFTDRGMTIARIQDGSSNTIVLMHVYGLCGSTTQGSAWGYGAGIGKAPAALQTVQPWARASYLKQTFLTAKQAEPFQIMPNPYATKCVLSDPATPHAEGMIVGTGDAGARILLKISSDTWNKACLPNDGNPMPADW